MAPQRTSNHYDQVEESTRRGQDKEGHERLHVIPTEAVTCHKAVVVSLPHTKVAQHAVSSNERHWKATLLALLPVGRAFLPHRVRLLHASSRHPARGIEGEGRHARPYPKQSLQWERPLAVQAWKAIAVQIHQEQLHQEGRNKLSRYPVGPHQWPPPRLRGVVFLGIRDSVIMSVTIRDSVIIRVSITVCSGESFGVCTSVNVPVLISVAQALLRGPLPLVGALVFPAWLGRAGRHKRVAVFILRLIATVPVWLGRAGRHRRVAVFILRLIATAPL